MDGVVHDGQYTEPVGVRQSELHQRRGELGGAAPQRPSEVGRGVNELWIARKSRSPPSSPAVSRTTSSSPTTKPGTSR